MTLVYFYVFHAVLFRDEIERNIHVLHLTTMLRNTAGLKLCLQNNPGSKYILCGLLKLNDSYV